MGRIAKYKDFIIHLPTRLHEGYSLDEMLTELQDFITKNEGTLDRTDKRPLWFFI